ncbi:MAG: MogA/MoaB family molybdenum cofactor biosynthesis protein [Oscillospiraceae bacterium]|nr:MogA/MoaB family molybdenum cofactor biosynthesis protein [Oscillospiraceae bacterium]
MVINMMTYTAAVVTVSDRGSTGEREDLAGPLVRKMLEDAGYEVARTSIVPDEQSMIEQELIWCADELDIALVVTTGGTGFSTRDVTPEATIAVCERMAPGIPEAMRAESMKITPRASLTRQQAGIRGKTLIVNLPGSPKAARENFSAVIDALEHGLEMLRGHDADCAAEEL